MSNRRKSNQPHLKLTDDLFLYGGREGAMAKILIVDHQPSVQGLLCDALTFEGYQANSVGYPGPVQECLLSSLPDLVLLGPYIDTPEALGLCENIKRQYPHLPVIIVTAYDNYTGDPRLSRPDGYVIMHVGFWDELKKEITHALRQKHSSQEFVTETYFPGIGIHAKNM